MKFLPSSIDKDNIMLCNMMYNRGSQASDYKDSLDIVYKDLTTGEKVLHTITQPEIEIFFVKPEHRTFEHNKPYIEISKCDPVLTTIRNIPFVVAKDSGESGQRFVRDCIDRKDFRKMNEILRYYYVFGADMDAESYYRAQWLLNYDNEAVKPVTKAFLDIEVDTIDVSGFPRDGECPINAVSVVDGAGKAVYTFLLDNSERNPQIQEFKDNINDFIDELHEAFDESYGVLDYRIYMYTDERKMLKDLFKLINTLKRDFLLIWNMGFDIPYIISRSEVLGMDPSEIICHRDFKNPQCSFIKDTRNFQVANKTDRFVCSSYTKYVDQMILYAATRKGGKELRSNSLNNVARAELGDSKLDYSDEADIKTLPYANYRKFVMYNIKDTLLQFGIERRVCDVDDLYLSSYLNCCEYDKVFKQTYILKRRCYYEYLLMGFILGVNTNVFVTDDDGSSYSGAVNNCRFILNCGDKLVRSQLLNYNSDIMVA